VLGDPDLERFGDANAVKHCMRPLPAESGPWILGKGPVEVKVIEPPVRRPLECRQRGRGEGPFDTATVEAEDTEGLPVHRVTPFSVSQHRPHPEAAQMHLLCCPRAARVDP
jgi:hypothetical protein